MNANRMVEVARAVFRPERYRAWHAFLFWLLANGASGISVGRRREDRRSYEDMEQAPFAPPGWLFAPVWALNNVSVLWGNLRLLNDREVPYRGALLRMQGAGWFLYATFAYVYFRKRSPILALASTATFWVLTIASVLLSLRGGRRDLALSQGTLLLWLTLATPTAAYQAAKNPDELFGTPPWR